MCVAEKLEIKNKVLYAIFNGAQMCFLLIIYFYKINGTAR